MNYMAQVIIFPDENIIFLKNNFLVNLFVEKILYISDTGSGIAPEHLQQVFDRFYKVDTARKRGKQGTGLGLFICRMIIHEHGGTIDVKSTLGKGTTFIITLPKPKTN